MSLPTKANVVRPRSKGYDALVEFGDTDNDSLYLRLATAPDRVLTVESAPPELPQIQTSETAEDIRPESGSTFSRTDFSGGEGLDRAHRRDGSDRDWSRYWDSRNIDVSPTKPGEPERIRLLHSTSQLEASAAALLRTVVVDGTLFFTNGVDVSSSSDPTASSPTITDEDPHDGEGDQTVTDVTGLGDQVYAAIEVNGIHQRSSGGSWSAWSNLLAVRVWGVKGRIVASTGTGLYEAAESTGGTPVTSVTGEDSDDLIDETDHGLEDGQAIEFMSLTGGSNLSTDVTYWVVNAATDTFQIAATPGGSALDFGSDISDATYVAYTANDVLLHTLPSGEEWTDVIDAGSAILAAGSDGLVYAFTPDENGVLGLIAETPMPRSEYPLALGWALGFVFVATGENTTGGGTVGRLWRFLLAGGVLEEGQNLREWGDGTTTLDRAPREIIATRDSIWTANVEDATESHVWRYHLSTAGLSRDVILGTSGLVRGLESIDDRVFATVASDGLHREDTTFASEGYLIGPPADFFSAAAKHWFSVRLNTPTSLDGTVLVEYTVEPEAITDPDDDSWRLATKATSLNPGDGTEQPLPDLLSRWLAFKILLQVGVSGSPEVDAVAFRAFHHPDEIVIQLPVNLSDRVELPGKKPFIVPGLGFDLWRELKELEGEQVTLTLLNPPDSIRGHVERITTPVPSDSERGSPTLYSQITVRGRRPDPAQEVEGFTFGIAQWGVPQFGGV